MARLARDQAGSEHRTVADQIERWARLGHACEHLPDFDYEHIRRVLAADLSPDTLSPMERAIYDVEAEQRVTGTGSQKRPFLDATS